MRERQGKGRALWDFAGASERRGRTGWRLAPLVPQPLPPTRPLPLHPVKQHDPLPGHRPSPIVTRTVPNSQSTTSTEAPRTRLVLPGRPRGTSGLRARLAGVAGSGSGAGRAWFLWPGAWAAGTGQGQAGLSQQGSNNNGPPRPKKGRAVDRSRLDQLDWGSQSLLRAARGAPAGARWAGPFRRETGERVRGWVWVSIASARLIPLVRDPSA